MTEDERNRLRAAFRRGNYVGRCMQCETALYEYDDMLVFRHAMWCRRCREEVTDYQPCA